LAGKSTPGAATGSGNGNPLEDVDAIVADEPPSKGVSPNGLAVLIAAVEPMAIPCPELKATSEGAGAGAGDGACTAANGSL
jgi:hypothetical protein